MNWILENVRKFKYEGYGTKDLNLNIEQGTGHGLDPLETKYKSRARPEYVRTHSYILMCVRLYDLHCGMINARAFNHDMNALVTSWAPMNQNTIFEQEGGQREASE